MASLAWEGLREFNAHELTRTLWSFAALLLADKPFIGEISSRLSQQPSLSPQDLVHTAWAFACLRWCAPLLPKMLSTVSQLNPKELASTAWSYATLLVHDAPLWNALAARSFETVGQFAPQHVCSTLWAFAHLD
mmetsp:Transcript_22102/g.51134  ORF Transcript_22102/g.51134 Transcript_22102/m.51134 type:complete len:134 (+) Transcript_22102:402-803(+)